MDEQESKNLMARQVDQIVADMEKITIANDEQYTFVAGWCKRNKETQAVVKAHYKPDIDKKVKELDDIKAEQGAFLSRLTAAETTAKKKMNDYWSVKEAARVAEETRIRAAKQKEIEDQRLADAENLSAAGKTEKADAVLEKQIRVGRIDTVAKAAPKVSGVSYRENWSARVVSFSELIQAVASSKASENLLLPCMPELNAAARTARKEGILFPGVVAVVEKTTVVG